MHVIGLFNLANGRKKSWKWDYNATDRLLKNKSFRCLFIKREVKFAGNLNKNLSKPFFPVSPLMPQLSPRIGLLLLFRTQLFHSWNRRTQQNREKNCFTWLINGKASLSFIVHSDVTSEKRKLFFHFTFCFFFCKAKREYFKCLMELMLELEEWLSMGATGCRGI